MSPYVRGLTAGLWGGVCRYEYPRLVAEWHRGWEAGRQMRGDVSMREVESLKDEELAEAVERAQRLFDAEIEREIFGREVLGEAWVSSWQDMPGEHVDGRQQADDSYNRRAWVYLDECICAERELDWDEVRVFGHLWQCLKACGRYTEIEQAWRVLELLECPRIEDLWGAPAADRWEVEAGPVGARIKTRGATAQEAICRAALKAVRAGREAQP